MQQIKLRADSLKYYFKDIDLLFLVFLVLILQDNLQLKVFGLFLISVLRFKAIFKINYLGLFYLLILFYHIFHGLINLFIDFEYFPNYIMVSIFWIFGFLIISQLKYFVTKNDLRTVNKTVDYFFILNIIIVLIQYFDIVVLFQNLNPYDVTDAAGDYIKSIYSNSSVNMLIMSFFTLMYLKEKNWVKGFIAVIILMMTTYMSGIFIFIFLLLISIYLFSNIKFKYKLILVCGAISLILLFAFISPGNVDYALGYIKRILENDDNVPFKIKSFIQTKDYLLESAKSFVFGAGGGNFSSRVAFIVSGDYVDWFPKSLSYVSSEFKENHFWIWQYDFNNPWDNINNTANQPFSFYNKILGEYGFIGLILFLLTYAFFYLKNIKYLSYSKFMIIILLGYFVLDYWFEYFSVIIIFELLTMKDINENKNRKSK